MDENDRRNDYTLALTQAFESGKLTPSQYADERSRLVGQGNVVDNFIIPVTEALWEDLKGWVVARWKAAFA